MDFSIFCMSFWISFATASSTSTRFSAYWMTDWKRLWAAALGAVMIHIIATILVPVIDHDAPFRLLPLVDIGFWQTVLALYLGYIIAIAAFFYVKTNVLQSGGAHASSH